MYLYTVFKEDGEIKFAINTPSSGCYFEKLKNYNAKEAALQVVYGKGQTYHIIYSDSFSGVNGSRCKDFYKMALQDELAKGTSLDFAYLSQVVVPALKRAAKSCYSLRINEGVAFTPVDVYIFNETNAFSITANYYIEEVDNVDSGSLAFEAIREAKKLSFNDYLEKILKLQKFVYPIVIGSASKEQVTIINENGDKKELNKEEYVCHW